MVVARLTALGLLLVFGGLLSFNFELRAQAKGFEKKWTAHLQSPSEGHIQRLRKDVLALGAEIRREGNATLVSYSGPQECYVALVNRLLPEPLEWTRWSCEKTTHGTVQGSIYLKKL